MGLFEKTKGAFSGKVKEKATEYSNLSDNALLQKDVSKQRKVTRGQVSTSTAAAACVGTGGLSAPAHGALAVFEGGKLAKQGLKVALTREIIERRNDERAKNGQARLQRRQPTFVQGVSDATGGLVDGALGTGAGADFLKALCNRAGK